MSDAGPVTPHRNAISVSSEYLRQERATNELKTSNVVPLEKAFGEDTELHVHGHGPGTAPEHVYEANMSRWRFLMRKFLVGNLPTESRWIAAMQASVLLNHNGPEREKVSSTRLFLMIHRNLETDNLSIAYVSSVHGDSEYLVMIDNPYCRLLNMLCACTLV